MRLEETRIAGVWIVHLDAHEDERGLFAETYDREVLAALGLEADFVLDAVSRSTHLHTVRGLHFQRAPYARAKLVRVTAGAVVDVALDLREGSPTYGRHVAVDLDARSWTGLFIPAGFAHGFCTLEPETEVAYKMTQRYAPDHYSGVVWNDPDLMIDWPVAETDAIVSQRDRELPRLRDLSPVPPAPNEDGMT